MFQDKATSSGPSGWFAQAMKPIWEKASAAKKKKNAKSTYTPNEQDLGQSNIIH